MSKYTEDQKEVIFDAVKTILHNNDIHGGYADTPAYLLTNYVTDNTRLDDSKLKDLKKDLSSEVKRALSIIHLEKRRFYDTDEVVQKVLAQFVDLWTDKGMEDRIAFLNNALDKLSDGNPENRALFQSKLAKKIHESKTFVPPEILKGVKNSDERSLGDDLTSREQKRSFLSFLTSGTSSQSADVEHVFYDLKIFCDLREEVPVEKINLDLLRSLVSPDDSKKEVDTRSRHDSESTAVSSDSEVSRAAPTAGKASPAAAKAPDLRAAVSHSRPEASHPAPDATGAVQYTNPMRAKKGGPSI